MLQPKSVRLELLLGLFLLLVLALSACQGATLPVSPAALQQIVRGFQAPAAPVTPAVEPSATPPAAPTRAAINEDAVPVALAIPTVGLEADVTPMGWELAMDGDKVTTRWVVPLDTLGWTVNSAEAGAAGNVVIIGHQALGAALLRPLALGEILPGQEIRLQTAGGATHLYQVREVSPPIPAIGATAEEMARSAAYLAPSTTPLLTLVSGWPADTTTHRVFVVAEYAGEAP